MTECRVCGVHYTVDWFDVNEDWVTDLYDGWTEVYCPVCGVKDPANVDEPNHVRE